MTRIPGWLHPAFQSLMPGCWLPTSSGPPGATSSNYAVTTDGRRFLMVKDEATDTAFSRQIVVVLGWANEVTRIERIKGVQS
jgi:hypothetical protein